LKSAGTNAISAEPPEIPQPFDSRESEIPRRVRGNRLIYMWAQPRRRTELGLAGGAVENGAMISVPTPAPAASP
jgi:hypothetical protein